MVKSTYLTLHNLKIGSNKVEVFKSLWQIKNWNKISFMIQRMLHNRLPTKIKFHKKQIQLLDNDVARCNRTNEDIFHVLFSCKVAQAIWWRWYRLLGIQWVSPFMAIDHFQQNSHDLQGTKPNMWWAVGWSSIVWNLWQQRNKMIFEEQGMDEEKLWHKILFEIWSWLKACHSDFDVSFQQWQIDTGITLAIRWGVLDHFTS